MFHWYKNIWAWHIQILIVILHYDKSTFFFSFSPSISSTLPLTGEKKLPTSLLLQIIYPMRNKISCTRKCNFPQTVGFYLINRTRTNQQTQTKQQTWFTMVWGGVMSFLHHWWSGGVQELKHCLGSQVGGQEELLLKRKNNANTQALM